MEQRTEHMDEQLTEQKTEREARRMTEQAADHRTEQTAGFSVYEELHMTLRDLINQKKEIEKQIEQNNLQIHEAECFTEEILSKDEEDFTVFSPRKYEEIYRDELDASKRAEENAEDSIFADTARGFACRAANARHRSLQASKGAWRGHRALSRNVVHGVLHTAGQRRA